MRGNKEMEGNNGNCKEIKELEGNNRNLKPLYMKGQTHIITYII